MANYVPVDLQSLEQWPGLCRERLRDLCVSSGGFPEFLSIAPLYKIPAISPQLLPPRAPSTISTARRRHLWRPDRTRTPPRPVFGARLCALLASLSSSSSVPRRFDSGSRSVWAGQSPPPPRRQKQKKHSQIQIQTELAAAKRRRNPFSIAFFTNDGQSLLRSLRWRW